MGFNCVYECVCVCVCVCARAVFGGFHRVAMAGGTG